MEFEINYHNASIIRPRNSSDYVLHNVDVFTDELELFGKKYTACCQVGCSYINGEYLSTSDSLELSIDNTDEIVGAIWSFGEDLSDDDLIDFCDEFDLDVNDVDNIYHNEYQKINDFIITCQREFNEYKINNCISDDTDEYQS